VIRPRHLAWLGLAGIAALSLAPADLQLRTGAPAEVEHFAAYLCAGSFLALVYGRSLAALGIIAAGLAGGAVALEVVQIWIPGRVPTIRDVVASAFGAFAGVIARAFLREAAARISCPRGGARPAPDETDLGWSAASALRSVRSWCHEPVY
jgi:VanZ family protein